MTFRLRLRAPAKFSLHLRIPAWCDEPQLDVSGATKKIEVTKLGFVRLDQEWCDGDVIKLSLKSRPRVVRQSRNSVGVKLGPLVLALPIGEDWRQLPERPGFGDWEVHPTTPWNYGLVIDDDGQMGRCRVVRSAVPSPPFGSPSLRVEVKGRRVDGWKLRRNSAGPIPSEPEMTSGTLERLSLVPYGGARLRVAEFPRLLSRRREPSGAEPGGRR